MSDHWSEYWSQGYLTSFGGAIKSNYEGSLKKYWEMKASELRDNFNVLDIATGNGSIPLLFNDILGEGLSGSIIGIDMASVKLTEVPKNSAIKIELKSNTNCEELPFNNQTFDKCTSQFGIEYSALEQSVAEVCRVLKVNGVANFIMHNTNSQVIKINRKANNILVSTFVDELFINMSHLIEHMGEVKSAQDLQKVKKDADCEFYRGAVNHCIKEIIAIDEEAAKESELMRYVGQFFTKGMMWPVAKKNEFLSFIKNEISSQRLRLNELLAAAMDEHKISALIQALPASLSLVSINEIKEEHQVIAWEMTFRKEVN